MVQYHLFTFYLFLFVSVCWSVLVKYDVIIACAFSSFCNFTYIRASEFFYHLPFTIIYHLFTPSCFVNRETSMNDFVCEKKKKL